MKIEKGSEWRKWDLHFHSPASYDYQNGSVTNQQIINELSNKDIAVVAITDHHFIDVSRIKELQLIGKDKGVTVLPGIEFLSDARGNEPIHFIGIFSETSNIEYIWAQIENTTNIKRIKGEGLKHNEVYCDLLETISIVKNLGGLVSIHAGKKHNGIENITHSLPHGAAQKEDIAKVIDIFEIGKEDDQREYLEKVIPVLKNKISKHIPIIICSDNHNITNYKAKQNLWIKADPTFEGLKQIIYEPEDRVRIQNDRPDFKEEMLIIEHARFISPSKKFTSEPIYFNENLNVIIGGKSSGKSLLLYLIAKTLLVDKNFLIDENITDHYKFVEEENGFNFEIKTKAGFTQFIKSENEPENSIIPKIKYIPQSYLVKLAEREANKKGKELNEMVKDLIIEDQTPKMQYEEFIEKLKSNGKKRETIIDQYFDLKDRITELEGQLKLKSQKEVLIKNIKTNTTKVEELNKGAGMEDKKIEEFKKLQQEFEEVKNSRFKAHSDHKRILEFLNETKSLLLNIQSRGQMLMNSLENENLKTIFTPYFQIIEETLQGNEIYHQLFETTTEESGSVKFKSKGAVSDLFENLKNKQNEITTSLAPYFINEKLKNQIEEISKSIREDKAAVEAIDQLKKEISECTKLLHEKKEELFNIHKDNYNEHSRIIYLLKERTDILEKDGLQINGTAKFNFPKFLKILHEAINNQTSIKQNLKTINEEKNYLSDYKLDDLIIDLKEVFKLIVETGDYKLKKGYDKKMLIKQLFDVRFFQNWDIIYKNDKLGEMSTGKASFVILMLIVGLSKSKSPILIDQPEDNLDNRSITSDLVKYLRTKKVERQIILVTHNPNVVVNADAENIIISNQKGQNENETKSPYQFDYINGPLENSFPKNKNEEDLLRSMGIREHIAEIVEGGEEAFKKREKKYGFR